MQSVDIYRTMNDGNLTSIIIALIALEATTITLFGGAVIYFAKWFSRHYGKDMKAHTEAAIVSAQASKKLSKAVQLNTEASEEMTTFMKNLNGKLTKATADTLKETKEIIKEAKK